MKKIIFALFFLATFLLIALPSGVLAQANVTNFQERIDLEGQPVQTPDGCEDLLHVGGNLHIVGHVTDLGDGNALVAMHFQPQGAVTQGMETGTIYRGIGVTRTMERTLGPGESFTFVNVFMQVPQAGVQQVAHVTVNANGQVTSTIDHVTIPGFSGCAD
jgi:hypothetical protein